MTLNQRALSIFDLLGPIMIGPSSNHTAGAVRIGKIARMILGEEPTRVKTKTTPKGRKPAPVVLGQIVPDYALACI